MKLEKRLSSTSMLLLVCSLLFVISGCKKLEDNPNDIFHAVIGETSTVAGNGQYGYVDGPGLAARFNNPNGVAVDVAGNLYVTDQANNMIRKITPAGVVSTFAGSGTAGSANGMGTAASFNNPIGIAVDLQGNVYIADFGNNLVRKITSGGVVSTYAGTGAIGFNDGPGIQATFNAPAGIAVDKFGSVYVSEPANGLIRKITPDRNVTRYAGAIGLSQFVNFANGPALSASFDLPEGLAVDQAGNLYVADIVNNMIRKIATDGTVSTLAGTLAGGFANGDAGTASFMHPYYVAVDGADNVYVTDNGNNVVRKITALGTVSTLAGTGTVGAVDGKNTIAKFNDLHGIAVDANGNVYVGDEQNNKIRKIQQNTIQ